MRRNNLSLVLGLLHDEGPRSRAAVAVETGLNKATVSSLVAELMERGLVQEVGTAEARGLGRPATLLELDGRNVVCLGVEVNVDVIDVVATDLAGRRLFERTRPLDAANATAARALKALTGVTRQALDAVAPAGQTLAGITVAIPGLVGTAAGPIAVAPNLRWRDLDVAGRLGTALEHRVPVAVENDANLIALAEFRVGQYAGVPNLVAITGQTGIGAGIVVDGRLLRGSTGFSGEVGHMHVDPGPDAPACGCGRRGCWEALVGLRAVLRAAAPDVAAGLHADPSLGPEDKVRVVVERAEAGDAPTLAALEQHARWVGRGLSIIVNLVNPQVVVLGGFFRDLAPWLLPVAEQELRDLVIAPRAGGCKLAVSTLGFSAAALGGAIHAAERVFDDPALVEPLNL